MKQEPSSSAALVTRTLLLSRVKRVEKWLVSAVLVALSGMPAGQMKGALFVLAGAAILEVAFGMTQAAIVRHTRKR